MSDDSLRYLTGREKAALSDFVARLRERYADEVVLVVLFGSKVRGDFDEESDLDVLVVVESDGWRFHREISFIGSRASLDYDVNISPKAVTQTLYRDLQELRTPFFENVQTGGVELWRRRESELSDYELWFMPVEEFTETIIADAEGFVARMERYLREVGAISKES